MKPIILLYNVDEKTEKSAEPVFKMLMASAKAVSDDELCMSVGHLAYPEIFTDEKPDDEQKTQFDISDFGHGFMLIAGMDKDMLNKLLNFMKKHKINIPVKAMMTETNCKWSFKRLIYEINNERLAIIKAKNK